MSSSAVDVFDLSGFCRAVEQRDAEGQVRAYASDAVVTIADRITQPGAPRVLRGREAIQAWVDDTCAREMTHTVQHAVRDENGAAFTNACRYPDGTNVLCATVLELAGGQITRQTVVQAWDED
jgi:hypothetical protein